LLPGNASANSAPTTARRRNMATSEAHITSSCADSASEPPHCNTNQINLTTYCEVLQSIRVRCSLHTATTSGCPISLQPNLLRTMYLSDYVCHRLLKFSKQKNFALLRCTVSLVEGFQPSEAKCHLHLPLAYSHKLNTEPATSPKTSVTLYSSTLDDRRLDMHHRENVKYYNTFFMTFKGPS
jgi:hypothetical protein